MFLVVITHCTSLTYLSVELETEQHDLKGRSNFLGKLAYLSSPPELIKSIHTLLFSVPAKHHLMRILLASFSIV